MNKWLVVYLRVLRGSRAGADADDPGDGARSAGRGPEGAAAGHALLRQPRLEGQEVAEGPAAGAGHRG